jgi:hypothetical protein
MYFLWTISGAVLTCNTGRGAALDSLNKYVYESHAGSKGWIYLVDRGIEAGMKSVRLVIDELRSNVVDFCSRI